MQDACDKGLDPDEFVEDMKKKGIRVAGIGHRIKSKVLSLPNDMPQEYILNVPLLYQLDYKKPCQACSCKLAPARCQGLACLSHH